MYFASPRGEKGGLEGTVEIPDSVARALALGWSVIPCRRDKRPCLSWKQFQSRKPTREEIQSWQSEYNPCAWAVITGTVSGVVVLDFDGETGDRTRTALKLTPHVETGSGGSHVYLDHPGWGTTTLNGKSKTILGEQFPGLDIRADGGYAVFCGQNESGSYQWVREMRPDPLDTVPNNLRAALGLLHPPEGGTHRPPASSNSQTPPHDRVAADRLIGRALEQAAAGVTMRVSGWPRNCAITSTRGRKPRQSYLSSPLAFHPQTAKDMMNLTRGPKRRHRSSKRINIPPASRGQSRGRESRYRRQPRWPRTWTQT